MLRPALAAAACGSALAAAAVFAVPTGTALADPDCGTTLTVLVNAQAAEKGKQSELSTAQTEVAAARKTLRETQQTLKTATRTLTDTLVTNSDTGADGKDTNPTNDPADAAARRALTDATATARSAREDATKAETRVVKATEVLTDAHRVVVKVKVTAARVCKGSGNGTPPAAETTIINPAPVPVIVTGGPPVTH